MSTQRPVTRPDTRPLPGNIDSPRAKLVYLALSTGGASTADELRDTLGLKKIDLFSILDTLDARGLVEYNGDRYVAR
jgi:DNA-binding MarR family transcriptional regulator